MLKKRSLENRNITAMNFETRNSENQLNLLNININFHLFFI